MNPAAPSTPVKAEETLFAAPVKLTTPLLPDPEPPLLDPVEDTIPPLEDALDKLPVVDVELRGTNTPPEMLGGEVLLPVLAAASLYASSVFGEGGALEEGSTKLKIPLNVRLTAGLRP